MRMLGALAITIVLASITSAEVFVTVYRCDGKTPLAVKDPNTLNVYSDIMVGTRLVLIVSSDEPWKKEEFIEATEFTEAYWKQYGWRGALRCTWDDWERGKLLGRGAKASDPDGFSLNYLGSCLPAAGIPSSDGRHEPTVRVWEVSSWAGFWLETLANVAAGDWFVLDYVAEKVGSSDAGLFDCWVSLSVPQETLTFNHVPSRDFNGDRIVNFADFASLASGWRRPVDPNASPARPCELDGDQLIGPSDLAMFTDYWLEQTDCAAAAEPNRPAERL
jgi:hypothetical protein